MLKQILLTCMNIKLVDLATNGVPTIVGVHNAFVAKLKKDILRLLNSVHCIAHRNILASFDAFKKVKH